MCDANIAEHKKNIKYFSGARLEKRFKSLIDLNKYVQGSREVPHHFRGFAIFTCKVLIKASYIFSFLLILDRLLSN